MAILAIFRHVGNDQKWPLEVSSMHQTSMGDPGISYLSAWALQALKRYSDFGVKRNTLMSTSISIAGPIVQWLAMTAT